MVDDHLAELVCILHGAAHEIGTLYIVSVIGERNSAIRCHIPHLRKLLAFEILGNRADHGDLHDPSLGHAMLHITQYRCIVDDRLRIRHSRDAGHTAGSGCLCACINIFLCFLSRFTQMDMHIDKTRCHEKTLRIDFFYFFASRADILTDFLDLAIFHQDICHFMLVLGRVYDGTILN